MRPIVSEVSPRILPKPHVSYWDVSSNIAGQELYEFLELKDSEPLFLSYVDRYAGRLRRTAFEENLALFPSYPPFFQLNDAALGSASRAPEPIITQPQDFLGVEHWHFFTTFGQESNPRISLEARAGFMEIFDLYTGQRRARQRIEGFATLEELSGPLRETAEFLVLVDPNGPVGAPLLVRTSGMEEIDAALRGYLKQEVLSIALSPGYYKIFIGP